VTALSKLFMSNSTRLGMMLLGSIIRQQSDYISFTTSNSKSTRLNYKISERKMKNKHFVFTRAFPFLLSSEIHPISALCLPSRTSPVPWLVTTTKKESVLPPSLSSFFVWSKYQNRKIHTSSDHTKQEIIS